MAFGREAEYYLRNGDQIAEQGLRELLLASQMRLRPVEQRDYPILLRWFRDSRVMPHLIGFSLAATESDLAQFWARERRHGYIVERNGGDIVFTATFNDPDPNDPDSFARMESAEMVRVAVDPFLLNRHIGTQSLILALDEAFNPQGLNYSKVAAGRIVTPDDIAGSKRIEHVLEGTLRFTEIGRRRIEVIRSYGGIEVRQDVVLDELARGDWMRERGKLIKQYFSPPQERRGFPFFR